MVVAGARAHESSPFGKFRKLGALNVVAMIDLQSEESGLDQFFDPVQTYGPAASGCRGVGHNGFSSRSRYPFDDVGGARRIVVDVVRASWAQENGESLISIGDDAGVDERIGDVRATYGHPGARPRLDRLPRNGYILGEPVDHGPGSIPTFPKHPRRMIGQSSVVWVKEVAQDMNRDPVDLRRHLHSANERDAGCLNAFGRLSPSGDGIVIGQPERTDPSVRRLSHELGRGRPAVGGRRVSVQIDHGTTVRRPRASVVPGQALATPRYALATPGQALATLGQ